MHPLFPQSHELCGSTNNRTKKLYQRYTNGIQKAGTSLLQYIGRDESRYSLRAPHNATSVIGDPAEVKGEDNFEIGISKA
jgi:hypothetical protein